MNQPTPAYNDPANNNWVVMLTDSVTNNLHTLNSRVRHRVKADDHPNEGGNPNPLIFLPIPELRQLPGMSKLVRGVGGQVFHGPNAGHADMARVRVTVNGQTDPASPPQARVDIRGFHTDGTDAFEPSFSNRTGRNLSIVVTPSYRLVGGGVMRDPSQSVAITVGDGTAIDPTTNPELRFAGTKRFGTDMGTLADYEITAQGSGQSTTTLAFLGDVEGTFTELDLASATNLFMGPYNRFFAPFFFDPSQDLFVGIDLTQWLMEPINFNFGQTVSFTNGVSDELPGIMVGTSEVILGASGFQTAAPFNGVLAIQGDFDGKAVPEPSASTLLLVGMAAVLVSLRYKPSSPR